MRAASIAVIACLFSRTIAQTFQRLGGCPELGCVFPPDQYVFLLFYLLRFRMLLDTAIPVPLGDCLDLSYLSATFDEAFLLWFLSACVVWVIGTRSLMNSLSMGLFVFSHPGPITVHHN